MFPVVLDTDVSSLLLKKRLPITLATKLIDAQLVITFVARAELTKWAEVRNWGVRNRQLLADWLAEVPILPGDEDVADTYGVLWNSLRRSSSAFTIRPAVGASHFRLYLQSST